MHTLNLGILAHVDAGKTSLTERLLHAAGVIDEPGSVDHGSTHTDSLALERRRGITIKSAVVSFVVNGVTVNLIDTPGHPDFIAEVERVLGLLDGAVLVVSAVEGVQPQTRVLMRALHRLGIPVLIFVNKIDRTGARPDAVLRAVAEKLSPAVVAMGSTADLGTPDARFTPYPATDAAHLEALANLLADNNDSVLSAYVDGDAAVPYDTLRRALAAQTGRALVHPVYFGSAITGAGVGPLIDGITGLLPPATGDAEAPAAATVFKVDRGPAGERIAYVRMFAGTIHVRDRLRFGPGRAGRVTAIAVFDDGTTAARRSVRAGRIAQLWGPGEVRIGDVIGDPARAPRHRFAPPTLETVIVPARQDDRAALHAALTQLAEQDPLINLRRDEIHQEYLLSLYGEVQKEVIRATLADEFGVAVEFLESTTICIERPAGSASAVELIGTDANPFLATVGLHIEPALIGSGVRFRVGIELGSLPSAFVKAVEETVEKTLQQGIHGWAVTDCVVTLTQSGYWARQSHAHAVFDKSMSSTAGDFRNLTPLVLMTALRKATTVVHEPMHRFRLELPADAYGAVLPALGQLRATPRAPAGRGSAYLVEGDIPAASVHRLQQQLPVLTSGEGVLESAFDHYRPVVGPPPRRPRADNNPLNRKEYLLHVSRRM